ncbi:MAG TPA: aminotransferase class I/II-fold pyridoxal phosphate-dependent enzyme [Candidatus Binataceae bacterium]|nr:aminotransferase class I/II-fold pyridoxal phosphate-dependent enzyme [Candidatus Binataceae bacterium]
MHQYWIRGSDASEIAASAERALAAGALSPGQHLPTVRALAADLRVSPATVAAAYRTLKLRGIICASGRRGTIINPTPPLVTRSAPAVAANVRNLAAGGPDPALLPSLPRNLPRFWSRHSYGEPYNHLKLLKIAERMFDADGIAAGPIAVTSGALDAIERLLQANLRIGDRVAVEDPGYPPVLDLVAAVGLRAEPVGIDEAGPVPSEFSRALKNGACAAIITPRAQNPTGAVLDTARVQELRRRLKPHPDFMVIEDDHAGPVAGAAALTVTETSRRRWAIVRSLSKSLGPDLRLALVAGDEMSIARLEGRQRLGPGWVSHLLQELAVSLWSDPNAQQLVKKAAESYSARRKALLDALASQGIQAHGRSGLNVWVPVPEEFAVVQSMLAAGWAISAGERYRIKSPPAVRISIATLKPGEAQQVAADLARTLAPRTRAHYA